MDDLISFDQIPRSKELVMLVGWRQWADAGSVSSGLPEYVIKLCKAEKIGELKPNGYYIFQFPGAHHLLRPVIRLEDGYRQELETQKNEFFYAGDEERGLIIFLGDEPHVNIARYSDAFFHAASSLGVTKIAGVGGVYGPVPYGQERQIHCIYSLKEMKPELEQYAVTFSNYHGGSSIGAYMVSEAEAHNVPYFILFAFVPAYDFVESDSMPQGIRIENDYKAWYDILRRFKHLLQLDIDLTDLQEQSAELIEVFDEKLDDLEEKMPQLGIREFLNRVDSEFTEVPFLPLDDVWEDELRNLFGDYDE